MHALGVPPRLCRAKAGGGELAHRLLVLLASLTTGSLAERDGHQFELRCSGFDVRAELFSLLEVYHESHWRSVPLLVTPPFDKLSILPLLCQIRHCSFQTLAFRKAQLPLARIVQLRR